MVSPNSQVHCNAPGSVQYLNYQCTLVCASIIGIIYIVTSQVTVTIFSTHWTGFGREGGGGGSFGHICCEWYLFTLYAAILPFLKRFPCSVLDCTFLFLRMRIFLHVLVPVQTQLAVLWFHVNVFCFSTIKSHLCIYISLCFQLTRCQA